MASFCVPSTGCSDFIEIVGHGQGDLNIVWFPEDEDGELQSRDWKLTSESGLMIDATPSDDNATDVLTSITKAMWAAMPSAGTPFALTDVTYPDQQTVRVKGRLFREGFSL